MFIHFSKFKFIFVTLAGIPVVLRKTVYSSCFNITIKRCLFLHTVEVVGTPLLKMDSEISLKFTEISLKFSEMKNCGEFW